MRDLISLLATAVLVGSGAIPGRLNAASLEADRPPNVLLIISDDQAWTDYGFMGHPHIRTPRLDRLAQESLLFPHGYVPTSLCCPSLASIITGLYPQQTRVTGNEPPLPPGLNRSQAGRDPRFQAGVARLTHLLDGFPTLPRLLARRGYQSFQSGKWWMGPYQWGGFTHGMTHGDPKRGGRHGDVGLKIGREGLEPIFDFLDQTGSQPWLIWYAPFLPHSPHNPPERLLARYRGSPTHWKWQNTGPCASGSTKLAARCSTAWTSAVWATTRWSFTSPTTAGFSVRTRVTTAPTRNAPPTTAACARRFWSAGAGI
jgi:arylsulfatase A-like enzyme